MRIPEIPSAYKELPNKTRMNAKEVIKMFGYKISGNTSSLIAQGMIPNPDIVIDGTRGASIGRPLRGKTFYWKLGTIRSLIN